MEPANGGVVPPPLPQPLSAEALPVFAEGISLVLSRWTALQMAVQQEWGGRESRLKSQQLANDILAWFTGSNEPLYIDDLEAMLDDCIIQSFNAEFEDGSLEEVAEQLMIMHEECLQGKFELIQKLRESNPGAYSVSQSRQIKESDSESSDDEADMVVDEPRSAETSSAMEKPQNLPDEEGWSVVAPRKGRGKR